MSSFARRACRATVYRITAKAISNVSEQAFTIELLRHCIRRRFQLGQQQGFKKLRQFALRCSRHRFGTYWNCNPYKPDGLAGLKIFVSTGPVVGYTVTLILQRVRIH